MNILIVDDQRAIVEGLKKGIDWEKLGIEEVYIACSAREAKLLLVNFEIQILMSDIEMPEEDGLSLFRWTTERYPGTVGIFLTSHADFDYAREALQLGCYDYILQPARYEDVEKAVLGAIKKSKENDRIHRLEHAGKVMADQRDGMLELLIMKAQSEKWNECREILTKMRESSQTDLPTCVYWSLVVQISHFEHRDNKWNEKMLKSVFRNVLEEVFDDMNAHICAAQETMEEYLIMVGVEEGLMTRERWEDGIAEFFNFINSQMEFSIAVYPEICPMEEFKPERYNALNARKAANTTRKADVFWEDVEKEEGQDVNLERIHSAEEYIRANISKGVTRTEVAAYLHLNEEYFSRLFKKYTGYTFKDYEMKARIDQAKKLLEHSRISVSIIASKLGYDNFSHFSRAFKKETGMTPQEYRKERSC